MKTALTIAGSDTIGGAGIQADIKTMTVNGVYAMSAATALTAQNTNGVTGIMEVSPQFLKAQIDAVFTDIYPDAVKIGMAPSVPIIEVIAESLKGYMAENIVVDPVMVSTSGSSLMKKEAVSALKELLFPIAALVTPNIPEAQVLSGVEIKGPDDMIRAAMEIGESFSCPVLLKGGHSANGANDLLYHKAGVTWFEGTRVKSFNTHGTGCTLSSAIAANLAKGFDLPEAVKRGKDYITCALSTGLDLGNGSGPLNHIFPLGGYFTEEK